MNKIAILLTGVLVASFVTVKTTEFKSDQPLDTLQEDSRVQEKLERYQLFKASFDATLLAMETGAISLREAQRRIQAVARENHPGYLNYLIHEEAGNTDAERIARNLVGHLQIDLDIRPARAPRVHVLEAELVQFVRDIRKSSHVSLVR